MATLLDRIVPTRRRRRRKVLRNYGTTRRDGWAPPPKTIFLAVNSACNLKCKMCDVGVFNAESQFYQVMVDPGGTGYGTTQLEADTIKAMADEVADYRPWIRITSTEPTLYKPITEVAAYIAERRIPVQITTNGLLLDRFAEDWVRLGLNELWVSLDAPPDLHNVIRGKHDSFERAIAGLRLVEEWKQRLGVRGPDMRVNCTITNHNYGALDGLVDALADLPLKSITFSHMNYVLPETADAHNAQFGHIAKATPSSVHEADPMAVDIDVLHEQVHRILARNDKRLSFGPDLRTREALKTFYRDPSTFVRGTQCFSFWQIAQVMSDGNLIGSTRCFNMQLGSVHEGGLLAAWNSEPMMRFRRALLEHGAFPACSRCCAIL